MSIDDIKRDFSLRYQPINNYLGILKIIKYFPSQEIEYERKSYVMQWQNVWGDIKELFKNPFKVAPSFAYSMLAFFFFFLGKHELWKSATIMGAITYDGVVRTTSTGTSLSVTVASNSNRLMIFRYGDHQGNNASSVAYNSVSMTKLVEQVGSFGENVSIWGLLSPSTGTNSVTWGAPGGSFFGIGIDSLYNTDTVLPAVTASATNTSSTASVSITPATNNNWIFDVVEAEATVTVGGGNTQDFNLTGQSFENVAGSEFQQSTAAAHTMTWSLTSGQRWNIAAIAIKPFVATSTRNSNFFAFFK